MTVSKHHVYALNYANYEYECVKCGCTCWEIDSNVECPYTSSRIPVIARGTAFGALRRRVRRSFNVWRRK